MGNIIEARELQIERKHFYVELRENERGSSRPPQQHYRAEYRRRGRSVASQRTPARDRRFSR
jgi:hypothetical protein